jgi:hypothetical protein
MTDRETALLDAALSMLNIEGSAKYWCGENDPRLNVQWHFNKLRQAMTHYTETEHQEAFA